MELPTHLVVSVIGVIIFALIILAVLLNAWGIIDITQILLEWFCLLKINLGPIGYIARLVGVTIPGGWAGCPA